MNSNMPSSPAPMNPMQAHKKELVILLIFTALAVAGVLLFFFKDKLVPKSGGPEPEITQVDPGKSPDSFPAIPISSDAVIVNNFNAATPDGRIQATRTFENSRSVTDNFSYYHQFLADSKNGWTVVSEVNNAGDPSHKVIFAKNVDGTLTINISIGRTPSVSLVDVTFLQEKK